MKVSVLLVVLLLSSVCHIDWVSGLILGGLGVGLGGIGIGLGGVGIGGIVLAPGAGCRCQAVEEKNHALVLRDFGGIQICGGLLLCGCGEIGIKSCRRVCERTVEIWADRACPFVLRDTEVRARFQSELCVDAVGDQAQGCDGNALGLLLPLLL